MNFIKNINFNEILIFLIKKYKFLYNITTFKQKNALKIKINQTLVLFVYFIKKINKFTAV